MTNRPPEAPEWIEAPYPWEGVAPATAAPAEPDAIVAAPKPWGYRLLAGMVVLGLLGSLAGGALSAKLRSNDASSSTPTTVPFGRPFPQVVPPPFATTPNAASATVNTDGIVNINTSSTINGLRGAGTGMVLTAGGQVLTNNHVVEGATRISVTTIKEGKTYTASVIGVSPSDDVALLQLEDAEDLTTIPLGKSSNVDIGDAVVSAGNAGGRGGTPTVASGTVRALNQTIQVQDELDDATETLRGLIRTDVPLQQGESGGPMFDDGHKVIGINTAASASFRRGTDGYAIPIDRAMEVVRLIRTGEETDRIHIGVRGFLGVSTETNPSGGARVIGVQAGSPADKAGLVAGDTVTAADGQTVTDASALVKAIRAHRPGESVTLEWTTASSDTRTGKAALAKGAAD